MDPPVGDQTVYITTSDPSGLVPAAIELQDPPLCADCGAGNVAPVVRRRLWSRANYRSGVAKDDPLPGVVPGRDFVTGVPAYAGAGVRRQGF